MDFTKIHGTGNDFIIINNTKVGLSDTMLVNFARRICKRKYSIGADGIIVIEHATSNADFRVDFYDTAGSVAQICSNGVRCAARYAYENLIAWENMNIETIAGNVYAWRIDKRTYKVKLNNPSIINLENKITIDSIEYDYSYIELGNPGLPHVVIRYKGLYNINNCDIVKLARKLIGAERFITGSKVSFYDIMDDNVVIRTYERGVEDLTLACGSAAGATAVVISLKNELPHKSIKFMSEGGELTVQIDKSNKNIIENIYLIGDTNIVATGKIVDEDLHY